MAPSRAPRGRRAPATGPIGVVPGGSGGAGQKVLPDGDGRGFESAVRAQLVHDRLDVVACGGQSDDEQVGDTGGGGTGDEQPEYLTLPAGEVVAEFRAGPGGAGQHAV